jgi:nicotinamide phosphoribosyltransferase
MNQITKNSSKGLLNNVCINSDSYKQGHFKFMKAGTTSVFIYGGPRTGGKFKEVVPFGLQMYAKNYLRRRVTLNMIEQAAVFMPCHGLPFNREGWEYIFEKHNGYLPLRIKAVEEGTVVPEGNVLFTVENTDPNCAWATNFIETQILRAAWYGTTVATLSREFKRVIKKYLELSGDSSGSSYKLVDFGARGVSSFESSYIGGAACLVSFMTTDNLIGIAASMEYYGVKTITPETITGVSIPASEHAVTTERGRDGELEFFSDSIDTFLTGPGTMVSLVSDTYSLRNAIKLFGVDLKDKIIASGGTLVVRPDSGNPVEMVLFTVSELDSYFGSTVNEKGYKVLHPAVRVIQGDGISIDTIEPILLALTNAGYSADNLTFGSGGGLLQSVTRDTERFAQKASHVVVDGVGKSIRKECETDPTKASLAGRLELVRRNGVVMTVVEDAVLSTDKKLLNVIYENGKLKNTVNFNKVRKNAAL